MRVVDSAWEADFPAYLDSVHPTITDEIKAALKPVTERIIQICTDYGLQLDKIDGDSPFAVFSLYISCEKEVNGSDLLSRLSAVCEKFRGDCAECPMLLFCRAIRSGMSLKHAVSRLNSNAAEEVSV